MNTEYLDKHIEQIPWQGIAEEFDKENEYPTLPAGLYQFRKGDEAPVLLWRTNREEDTEFAFVKLNGMSASLEGLHRDRFQEFRLIVPAKAPEKVYCLLNNKFTLREMAGSKLVGGVGEVAQELLNLKVKYNEPI